MFSNNNSSADRKKEIKATSKQAQRELSHSQRGIDKEIAACNKAEKELVSKIQTAHKRGNQNEVKLLAKQMIKVRENKDRLLKCSGQLSGVAMKTKAAATNAVMAETLAGATKAISAVNAIVDPKTVMKDMNNFAREIEKMEVTEEAWDDMVDVFDGDDVEVESDNVVNSIMDELGISLGASMAEAPNTVLNFNRNIVESNYNAVPEAGTGSTQRLHEQATI